MANRAGSRKPAGKALTEDDSLRIARLYEEASGKLYEASMIAARAIGHKSGAVEEFHLGFPPAKFRTQAKARDSMVLSPTGRYMFFRINGHCGAYDFEEQVCIDLGPC